MSATVTQAQHLREGYVDWNSSEDAHFFISRVRPHEPFRDSTTQVRPDLDEAHDKQLCMWMPIGTPPFNALPDGVFDRDAFSMWHYVTHLGNWTAPLARVPGALTDVAHRNGVGVSCTLSIPYGPLGEDWMARLEAMTGGGTDTEAHAHDLADTLRYYGVDGIGYNSEFSTQAAVVQHLADFHEVLLRDLRQDNPLAEVIWYDGTSDDGTIQFDQGLYTHNDDNFGEQGHERSNLFLNYNWNTPSLLTRSVQKAEAMGRSPLDLYCGFNLQGREPHDEPRWTLLQEYPLSIGLWGAHSENMFYESRAEQGYSPQRRQETYLTRQETWFTGGSRSAIGPHTVNNSLRYDTENTDFHGMSALMSARSALSWDLSDEPFVTCFNLGNGRYFNWCGQRVSDREWHSLGLQDHLPTWRWWLSPELLGRDFEHEAPTSVMARLSWSDAWLGGSSLQLTGSADAQGVNLHLFKMHYELHAGDRISLTYKLASGDVNPSLVVVNADLQPIALPFEAVPDGEWHTMEWIVGQGVLDGVTEPTLISLLALHVADASAMDLRLGRLAIIRDEVPTPALPVIERASLLLRHAQGVDGKVIFHTAGRYNLDSGTSFFKVYAQTEEGEVSFVGATTSWAAIAFAMPCPEEGRVRIGVSAIGVDLLTESEISWSEWLDVEGVPMDSEEPSEEEPDEPDTYPVAAGQKPQIHQLRIKNEGTLCAKDTLVVEAEIERGEGAMSQAVLLGERGLGFAASDIRSIDSQFFTRSFSIGFWVIVDAYHARTQLLNITDRTDYWPQNNMGWFWHIVGADGRGGAMTWRRKTSFAENISYSLPDFYLSPGRWHYLLYVFDMDNSSDVAVRLYLDGELQSGTNDKGRQYAKSSLYGFRSKNVVAVGGMMFGSDGIDGRVDELSLWNHALTPEEVAEPFAHWDFETPASAEGLMYSSGKHEGIGLFLHRYKPGEREGEGILNILPTVPMASGAPLAPGFAWVIQTQEQWKLTTDGSEDTTTDQLQLPSTPDWAGFAFAPQQASTYSVQLSLTNAWGSDTLALEGIEVTGNAGLPAIEALSQSSEYYYDLMGRRHQGAPCNVIIPLQVKK